MDGGKSKINQSNIDPSNPIHHKKAIEDYKFAKPREKAPGELTKKWRVPSIQL